MSELYAWDKDGKYYCYFGRPDRDFSTACDRRKRFVSAESDRTSGFFFRPSVFGCDSTSRRWCESHQIRDCSFRESRPRMRASSYIPQSKTRRARCFATACSKRPQTPQISAEFATPTCLHEVFQSKLKIQKVQRYWCKTSTDFNHILRWNNIHFSWARCNLWESKW